MDNNNNNENENTTAEKPKKPQKPKQFFKRLFRLIIILAIIALAWAAFCIIGRVNAASVIPDSAELRISVSSPMRLLEGILDHESLDDILTIPSMAKAAPALTMLKENNIFKNGILRLATSGNMEFALLPPGPETEGFIAVWDFGFFSPLLRILPVISNFVNIDNLYYVQTGSNSRFEYRMGDMTLFIGPYRNLLFVTNNPSVFESRSASYAGHSKAYSNIKPSDYDAALMLSNEFIAGLLGDQDPSIAALLSNIQFDSKVEAGFSVFQRKIEFRLAAPLSSGKESLNRLLTQRSQVPGMAERIPADTQYATILSAGTLEEIYQTALVFTPDMDGALKTADAASRFILGLSLNDLLFSWTGNELAAFGMDGRPHPVYAVKVSDERKRQEVFDKAFQSVVLSENVRLNLDGVRIPQIVIPEFLQALLRRWNIFMPAPYYYIYRDYFFVSESADTLLAAIRAMQRNDVLPRTAAWKNIAGGKTTASAFSLYYSLDVSVPFFLRKNTVLSDFLSLYRQGLARMSFDRGVIDISLSLIPGSGNGVTLVNGYPREVGGRPINRIYSAGRGEERRIFFSSSGNAYSLKVSDNTINELTGQGTHWIVPADGVGGRDAVNAWVVTDRGRVTLVDGDMEIVKGFPLLTGLRISSHPQAYEGKLYLCDEDGKVHIIDEKGEQSVWQTSFTAALRSPPSFLTLTNRRNNSVYAAVYPKSFFGEIWLLDADGKPFPNWPAPIAVSTDEEEDAGFGVGFGSPLLFIHNGSVLVAFINQSGQLLIYDENAALVPPFPVTLDGIFFLQPVFDGDYLWLASSDGTFFRVSLDGEVLYQKIHGFSVKEEGYITTFDSDNDKAPEVYITGEGNALYAYTRNFRSLEGFPLPAWGRPVFNPAQGSRKADIFAMGMNNRLYRWQFK